VSGNYLTFSKMIKKYFTIFFLFSLTSIHSFAQVPALPHGFAHNDYMHKRPLYEALENGYTNIEADIFLHNKKLIVAHVFPFFKKNRTLERLYLKPLYDFFQQHNVIYDAYYKPIILMIDIKSEAYRTFEALKPLLQKYASILSTFQDGKFAPGKVTIVLSGNKPFEIIESDKEQLAFFDTDFRYINKDTLNSGIYVMASCKYSKIIKWRGKGKMPGNEKEKLTALIKLAHLKGRKVRLWASPENPAVWTELLNCGIDFINTDRLTTLRNFLLANSLNFP
jgi:Glycerophosphoryl diester phosphodiesterase family